MQRVGPVGGEGEERAGAVGMAGAGFIDNRVDASLLQRHRCGWAGDATADDQGGTGAGHGSCLSLLPSGWSWKWANNGPQSVFGLVMRPMSCVMPRHSCPGFGRRKDLPHAWR
jgi:hypothetical protein